ncbi:MAG: ABC transporter substrate-binding protein [Mogibacterium sp.]|nr:ABC transporter substrate-binding protein [Mogibacterium sp.]
MKKKLLALVLVLTLVISALAACGGGGDADGGGADGDAATTLVVAMEGAGLETFDPGNVYETYASPVMNLCYDNLFNFVGDDPNVQPILVESYQFSEDAKTLTCVLKPDLKFASGNPLTSADVAFSINRCKNLKGNPSFITDTIESIETPDERTVVFHLTEPDSAFISKLTYKSMAILDSEAAKEQGATDAADAAETDTARNYLDNTSLGSGPFVLEKYTPNEEIVLVRNENYWGEPSDFERVVFKLQSDANTQMMTLTQGDVDIALNLTDDTVAQLDGAENVAVVNKPSMTVCFVMFNMDPEIGGPMANKDVQQAVRLCLDYQGIQQIVGEGTVTPYSFLQDGFMGSKGTRDVSYTDIEAAKQKLADAGYPDGFDVELTVCDLSFTGTALTDVAQKVKDDLAKIGINVTIVQQPWAAGFGDAYRAGEVPFTVMYWNIDYFDPNVQLEFLPGKLVGLRAKWTEDMDPEIAALIKDCMAETDDAKRAEILGKLQDMTYENGPFIFVAQGPCHYGYNTRLTGVTFSAPHVIDLTQVKLAE